MRDVNECVVKIAAVLKARNHSVVTAESCTGGGVASALTELAGSSEWFEGGFVTYSNASKIKWLDVSAAVLAQYGAVSEEIAEVMVRSALKNSDAEVALSVTGIAGPTGAVAGKPVGTICFAWATKEYVVTERLLCTGDRQAVREQAVAHALEGLLRFLAQH